MAVVMAQCERCGETIYWYVHSQAGPIQAGAWSTIPLDLGDVFAPDPRYGTRCDSIYAHAPESPEEEDSE